MLDEGNDGGGGGAEVAVLPLQGNVPVCLGRVKNTAGGLSLKGLLVYPIPCLVPGLWSEMHFEEVSPILLKYYDLIDLLFDFELVGVAGCGGCRDCCSAAGSRAGGTLCSTRVGGVLFQSWSGSGMSNSTQLSQLVLGTPG